MVAGLCGTDRDSSMQLLKETLCHKSDSEISLSLTDKHEMNIGFLPILVTYSA